jgi:hypothetical protein
MYDGSVEIARFPDFSPLRKLEIWCEIISSAARWLLSCQADGGDV